MRAKRKGRGRVKVIRGQADQRTSGPQLHQTTSWPSICPAEVAAWPRFRLVILPPGHRGNLPRHRPRYKSRVQQPSSKTWWRQASQQAPARALDRPRSRRLRILGGANTRVRRPWRRRYRRARRTTRNLSGRRSECFQNLEVARVGQQGPPLRSESIPALPDQRFTGAFHVNHSF